MKVEDAIKWIKSRCGDNKQIIDLLESQQANIDKLQQDLATSQKWASIWKDSAGYYKGVLDMSDTLSKLLEEKLTTINNFVQTLNNEIKAMENKIDVLVENLCTSKQDIATERERSTMLDNAVDHTIRECTQLRGDNFNQQQRALLAKDRAEQLEDELRVEREKVKEREQQVVDMRDKVILERERREQAEKRVEELEKALKSADNAMHTIPFSQCRDGGKAKEEAMNRIEALKRGANND